MRPPTLDQLRNIADRADRGPLTAAEVSRLREGIDGFDLRTRSNMQTRGKWASKIRGLRIRLHKLHTPMVRGGMQICTACSGWNGTYCAGLVTEWPCPTLDVFDTTFPVKESS